MFDLLEFLVQLFVFIVGVGILIVAGLCVVDRAPSPHISPRRLSSDWLSLRFNQMHSFRGGSAGYRLRCRALARWGRATGGAEGADCGALFSACGHMLATP